MTKPNDFILVQNRDGVPVVSLSCSQLSRVLHLASAGVEALEKKDEDVHESLRVLVRLWQILHDWREENGLSDLVQVTLAGRQVRTTSDDITGLIDEVRHLRAQRDELQATCTRLEEEVRQVRAAVAAFGKHRVSESPGGASLGEAVFRRLDAMDLERVR